MKSAQFKSPPLMRKNSHDVQTNITFVKLQLGSGNPSAEWRGSGKCAVCKARSEASIKTYCFRANPINKTDIQSNSANVRITAERSDDEMTRVK